MPQKEMPRNSGIKTGNALCGFHPGRSPTDQMFTLKQIFEKCWKYAKDLFFVPILTYGHESWVMPERVRMI